MPRQFLDPSFIKLVRDELSKAIPSDSGFITITRKQLCEKIDLDLRDMDIISKMFRMNLLPEFTMKGMNGIGRKGCHRPPATEKTISPEFVERVRQELDRCFSQEEKPVISRSTLARRLGDSSVDAEVKISAIIAQNLLPGYGLKRGIGFYRTDKRG